MFTNEFKFEHTITTVMDETGEFQDAELIIDDDGVYIRQFTEEEGERPEIICLTHKMFKDMVESLGYPEGMYQTEYNK